MRIIDFHTHPFIETRDNLKRYHEPCDSSNKVIREDMERAGISMFCGAVLHLSEPEYFDNMRISNAHAMQLFREMPDTYMPGVLIDPTHVRESCEEIEKAHRAGCRMVGEINTGRMPGRYSDPATLEILEYAESLGMVVSCHSADNGDMDALAAALPHLQIVNAHPNEYDNFLAHIERMRKYENVHLDLSGTGLFRFGMLRKLVNEAGAERVLFGTDYPVCNPAMYVQGILYERLTSGEQEAIFYKNAERLLQL